MSLSGLKWETLPLEKFHKFEKAVHNSRTQRSNTVSILQDVSSLIKRLADEENYIFPFYVLTLVRHVSNEKIDWEIEGYTVSELSKLKEYLSLENVHVIVFDESGSIDIY